MSHTISRREFIRQGAGMAVGSTLLGSFRQAALADETERRPNLIFIFADQMRACSMGCMGNAEMKTPNMDKLASQGVLFTNALSGYPICSPYRAMLLTGRYCQNNGVITNFVPLPNSEVSIAEVLKAQGYKTGYVGKWHLQKLPNTFIPKSDRQGFDYWVGMAPLPKEAENDPTEHPWIRANQPMEMTEAAIRFVRMNAKGQDPFCLFLSWYPPHNPYDQAPREYMELYDLEKVTPRPNVHGPKYSPVNQAGYQASISWLDDCLGRMMKALDEMGIAEDTILVFSSDHGDMMGSQGMIYKCVPYEESVHIPFILRYPRKVKAGSKSDVLLNAVDVMPTLLSLCGAPIPKNVEGTDLSSFVLGKGGRKPESAFLQCIIPSTSDKTADLHTWRGVRTERYTYARFRDKGWLLFDNKMDPYQMNNLIGKPEAKPLQEKLEAELQKWLKKTGDDFATIREWRQRIKDRVDLKLIQEKE